MGEPHLPDYLAEATTEFDSEEPVVAESRARAVPAAGERIGRFEVIEVLGRGGMGIVVAAWDPRLERRVAVKLVAYPEGGDEGGEVRRRLVREARAMARLRHRNVVTVYEAGEHDGRVYVAMEELQGGTLRDAVREASGWRELIALFAQAGRGLAAAHAADLVHRDFKPDNVFLDGEGCVRVGDFGLARSTGAEVAARDDGDVPLEAITRVDQVLGTPAYMAPEQQMGLVDARSDQFAFCVALYEALYGRLPFAGETRSEYLAAMASGSVRPPDPARRVPRWVFDVLTRGMAADPAERYDSMEDLLIELGASPALEHRTGQLQRTLLLAGAGLFVVLWAPVVLGFDWQITYRLHYASDLGFLALFAGIGLLARHALLRTRFNRQVYGIGLTTAVGVLALTAGGDLLGISPDVLASLHLLIAATTTLGGAALIDRRVSVIAASYFAAFFASALWPSTVIVACLLAHTVTAIGLLVIFRLRARSSPEPW